MLSSEKLSAIAFKMCSAAKTNTYYAITLKYTGGDRFQFLEMRSHG
ncbi:hypothetical protein [Pseudanabaena sp. Chao 1811]|nr:hypothetical protein [Pseudanabaena sp. Chao 1811]